MPAHLERSLRLMGRSAEDAARIAAERPPADRLERVARIVADFDALDSRRKRAVNPRELVQRIREAIE